MTTVMCTSCGEFLRAIPVDGETVPVEDACPACGESSFAEVDDG